MRTKAKIRFVWVMLAVALVVFEFVLRASGAVSGEGIATVTTQEARRLQQVFPAADEFSLKEGEVPHHKAYRLEPETGERVMLGFVFETRDVEPREVAYSSVINALVGLTLDGSITKVVIMDHREPYGFISIDPPRFAAQFEDKSILDRFRVGRDIDAVSGATITLRGAARIIRKSARRIAQQHLKESNAGQ